MSEPLNVWVAYAAPQQQFLISVPFVAGMTAMDAVEQSGICEQTELPEPLKLGIFGVRLQDLSQQLNAGDRVELYRNLTINPKDIRRKRAEKHPVGRFEKGNRFKQLK